MPAATCFNAGMLQEDLLDRIAANLRELRERRGVTREQLGATAAVDPQMIKRIENGRANPALVVLSRLASALMISLSLMLASDVAAEPMLPTTVAEIEPFEADAVGQTITALRKHRRMSRRALAQLVDLRTLTLSRYESAQADARLLSVRPIARAFGLTPEDFVREVERRGRQPQVATTTWQTPAEGVQSRLVSSGNQSLLWEWRIAPGATSVDEPSPAVAEEITTAIRGEVRITTAGNVHRLRRGASISLPVDQARTIENTGRATARLLRFQVIK
jgi:transcriptional regulator with XRE-family HTH domain